MWRYHFTEFAGTIGSFRLHDIVLIVLHWGTGRQVIYA